jgi:NADPH-dependent 2,4-dienoyl-CoA reductase/sulfur reductase-like enzyme
LIEASSSYTTCFFSNWYLGGFRSFESITHGYGTLASEYGIKVVNQWASGVDADARRVALRDGGSVPYDRLVVAPGIDFRWDTLEGYGPAEAEILPHAYQAGPQTRLLRRQILEMRDGGTFLMIAPPNPFRCPPGPYERVSMVAHYLKHHKPGSKIIILDHKSKHSKQALFEEAWATHYPGMIEWLPGEIVGRIKAINAANKTVATEDESFTGDVVNVIPAQKAGAIAHSAGLADETGWCPIKDASTFESALVPDVHVLGDASINGAMPKSGFSANSQAKVVAMAVNGALTGAGTFPARFRNTCWSLLATEDAVKVGASYKAEADKVVKVEGFISETEESAALRAQTKQEAIGWYSGITADIFG